MPAIKLRKESVVSRARSRIEKMRQLEATWPDRIALRARVAGEQGWRCCYCPRRLRHHGRHCDSVSLERVLPGYLGGEYTYENCVACCNECNTQRDSRMGPEQIEALTITWDLPEADVTERLESLYREKLESAGRRKAA
jgi:5-methylcytosine-specific restriction endonuclease McrA